LSATRQSTLQSGGHLRSRRGLSPGGYLIRDFGFSEADLAEAGAYTKAIKTTRVQDAWLANGAIKRLATDRRMTEFLSEPYQREAFAFQTLNFPKGSEQGTHSDTYHFNSIPTGFMCRVWIALEDIHPDSGPLQYHPGSHRLPVFSNTDLNGNGPSGYLGLADAAVNASGIIRETAKITRGQAFIWAANLFHGGSPIADPALTRLSQVTHYYFRGCSYFTPLASANGEVFWREPYDIAAGRFVANADRSHRPRLKRRIGERLQIWTRKPHPVRLHCAGG
ncbi:MAG: phytanoyl-CoA dioxygenase family protein, partial [Hyphomonadaceae bacterium]|nr:phytanoyl-CoA dioxygenase family protein [Hyphomonadaceae bacterium]